MFGVVVRDDNAEIALRPDVIADALFVVSREFVDVRPRGFNVAFCDVCALVAVPRAVAADCVPRVETVPDVRRVAARAVASESVAFAPKTAPMPRHTAKNSLIPFILVNNLSKIMNLRASEKTGFFFGAGRGT